MVKDDDACVRERGAHDLPILAYTAYGEARPEIAETLLRGGADVRANAFGLTALHLAAGKGYVALAEVLLAGGADVNAAGTFQGRGITPWPPRRGGAKPDGGLLERSRGTELTGQGAAVSRVRSGGAMLRIQ